ncbi:rhodanese-like domain-containing protein [Novosphingobium sp.]|uniref:rhodanese-like domain-containing protein n=1 Tax=Novosphingobium sp. TaxID=1874826 RepID=UPI0026337765|nr:rhodanese-like domain-containing protein [Novosphingobium sp.]
MNFDTISAAKSGRRAVSQIALAAALAAVLPVTSVFAQDTATTAPAPAAPKLAKAQIDALLTTPDKVVFIDVRRADEISEIGSLPVILNIQISELDRFLAYIPRDRQIVTISNHAGRAGKAAALLQGKGFTVAGAIGIQD